jgi:hypothetical protein
VKGAKKLFRIESSEQRSAFWRLWGFVIKLAIAGFAIGFIGTKLNQRQEDLSLFVQHLFQISTVHVVFGFFLPAIFLMVLNWLMEVVKWKLLLEKSISITWKTSIKAVLSGTTIGVFSPNRIGEFIGRVLALKPEDRVKGSLLSAVNGLAQSLGTFTFGIVGLLFLLEEFAIGPIGLLGTKVLQLTLVITLALAFTLYLRFNTLGALSARYKWLRSYHDYLQVFREVDSTILIKLYNLSLIRFATFIVQYIVVFSLLFPSPNFVHVAIGSTLTLFSSALISFLPVPDLLIRESIALSYFELYDFDLLTVSIGVLIVWLLNIALPALLGTSALFTYRIFRTK